MVKIDNKPDKDGCIEKEICRDIFWYKDKDGNALFQEVDGGQRKIVEFPKNFNISHCDVINEGKAFYIEGENGKHLTCFMRGTRGQFYAVGKDKPFKTDKKGRIVLETSLTSKYFNRLKEYINS